MSEKSALDSMLAGELYRPDDPTLVEMRRAARRLSRLYHSTTEDDPEQRASLISQLFGQVGEGARIEAPLTVDYGKHIKLGRNVTMNFGCVILDCAWVEIGDYVSFGPSVQIYTAQCPLDPALREQGLEMAMPIRIGRRVAIGGNAIICPGVTIGENSTVGAGSVVTRDIPPNVVAVGNPCRVLHPNETGA